MNQTNKDIPAQLEAFAESAKKAGLTSGDRVLLGAAEYVRELEAVVETLPQTADGAYVTPGMRYWFEYVDEPGEFGDDLASEIRHDGGRPDTDFSNLYSTREAALAAKEARDAK